MPSRHTNEAPPASPAEDSERTPPNEVRLLIPWSTWLKAGIVVLIAYCLHLLLPLLLNVLLALLLAVTMQSLVDWLDSKGCKHGISILIAVGGMLLSLAAIVALIVPSLVDQGSALVSSLPGLRDNLLGRLPAGGAIRQNIEHLLEGQNWEEAGKWAGHVLTMGGAALGALSEFLLMIVIAIYLLVDGAKAYEWLLAFFSPQVRRKLRTTATEVSKVIFGYVAGQVITSVLVAVYAFAVLSLLKVPAALVLAILAGLLDILPVVGFVLSTIPAFLLALSVSPQTAFLLLGLYVLFHGLEVYFIIPKVYGKSLRLSTLTVLLSLLAGTLLAGIPGALAALPVIASYTAIERIWLKPYLREGVPEKHEQQKIEEFGEKA